MASDEGFREFQLGGKHLVALFMFTTIVAVVIFLCGVMVGRGVRNNTTAGTTDAAAAPAPAGDLAAAPDVQAGPRGAQAPGASAAPPPPVEDAAGEGKADTARVDAPAVPPAKATAADGKRPAAADARASVAKTGSPAGAPPVPSEPGRGMQPAARVAAQPPATTPGAGVPGEPAGEGFVVQVAAMTDKAQAEALARRLLDKSYAAYVVAPAAGGGMFRVRIGKFKQRRDAETIVRRLKKEDQIEAWIPPVR